jgi:SAM-dependent methyltransferase
LNWPITRNLAVNLDDAIRFIRTRHEYEALVRDSYLGPDVEDSARRFAASGEFAAVRQLLGDRLLGAVVLDLGAGTGIASAAFLAAGARCVFAVEPDESLEVGYGAMRRLLKGTTIHAVAAVGERLPIRDRSADVVYARQVLHHTRNLALAVDECARVLRPGGLFIACREHVVDDSQQLAKFLETHPMHQLAGGENAFTLKEYRSAIDGSGLRLERVLGPWDSVINAFPAVATDDELAQFPRLVLQRRFGAFGPRLASIPGVSRVVWRRLRRPIPGRLYSFVASRAS